MTHLKKAVHLPLLDPQEVQDAMTPAPVDAAASAWLPVPKAPAQVAPTPVNVNTPAAAKASAGLPAPEMPAQMAPTLTVPAPLNVKMSIGKRHGSPKAIPSTVAQSTPLAGPTAPFAPVVVHIIRKQESVAKQASAKKGEGAANVAEKKATKTQTGKKPLQELAKEAALQRLKTTKKASLTKAFSSRWHEHI